MKNESLFALGPTFNPFYLIDKYMNPFRHSQRINLSGNPVDIFWTNRAHKELQQHENAITVEMQLYFSCLVQKRVLFHTNNPDFKTTAAHEKLFIVFHAVEAASCDPVEFAKHHPAKRILDTTGALKMKPKKLEIDFKNHQWIGAFTI